MSSGIYIMYFDTDEESKYYVGYSQNIEERKKQHYRALKANTHYNYLLQSAYFTYNKLPEFEVLEYCSVSDLPNKEIYWIERYDAYVQGFNLSKGGLGGGFGESHYLAKYTEHDYINIVKELAANPCESIVSICSRLSFDKDIAYKISVGAAHAYLKELIPLEYSSMLQRLSKRNMGLRKYSKDLYVKVFMDLVSTNMKHTEIQGKYSVSSGCVEGISCGDTHKYFKEDFPEEYEILMNKKLTRRNKSSKLKQYPSVIDPKGIVHNIGVEGAKAFALAHGLHQGHFSELLLGKNKTHKGWSIYTQNTL